MPSLTDWTRIEPRTRDDGLIDGLSARIHDPLWLLTRQWQLGELLGADGGSPVEARIRLERTPLSRFHPGPWPAQGAVGRHTAADSLPLEARVEREALAGATRERFAVDAGMQFLRLLDQRMLSAYRSAYIDHYAVAPPPDLPGLDAAARRFLSLAAGRVPDGLALRSDLTTALRPADGSSGTLPTTPPIADDHRPEVTAAAHAFLDWCDEFFREPNAGESSWVDAQMEYAFAVGGHRPGGSPDGGEEVLVAAEYTDGILEWFSFDRMPGAHIGAAADGPAPIITRTAIPSQVTYPGMPSVRWWELEDAEVDFGAVEAAPEELARLLLVEFALVYANDWFLVPAPLPVGSLYHTRSLVVKDTFGRRVRLRPYTEVDGPNGPWKLFHLSGAGDPALLLAPTLPAGLEGQPLEEVLFLRDEMANLAWAVERLVPGPHGRSIDRHELEIARRAALPLPEPAPTPLAYQLATQVPQNWIPLVPVRDSPTDPLRLRRAQLLQGGPEGLEEPEPLGRILLPDQALELQDQEVPRSGSRVYSAFQCARAADGSTHLWLARRKSPGRGEGFSGLRFDVVEETGLTEEPAGDGAFDISRFGGGDHFAGA